MKEEEVEGGRQRDKELGMREEEKDGRKFALRLIGYRFPPKIL